LLGYVLLRTKAESMLEPRELTIGEDLGLSIGLAIPFSSKGGWNDREKRLKTTRHLADWRKIKNKNGNHGHLKRVD
jgi:hypothetical protein